MALPQSSSGFQTFVNDKLPIGVPGDFAGANPKMSMPAPPGGFRAPAAGLVVGAFGWGDPSTGILSNYYKPNSMCGFVHRQENALITTYLGINSLTIQPNSMANAHTRGDFKALFSAGGTPGQKVYADPLTGVATANATGQGVTANSTAASVATTGIVTVGATLTGTITVGMVATAAGIPEGSYVSAQLTGSAGSTGTYQLTNVNGTAFAVVSSTTINFQGVIETQWTLESVVKADAVGATSSLAATGILTIGSLSSGTFEAGQFISGTGLPLGDLVVITGQLSGTVGGAGTYSTNAPSGLVVSSTTITGTAGKVGRISTWN